MTRRFVCCSVCVVVIAIAQGCGSDSDSVMIGADPSDVVVSALPDEVAEEPSNPEDESATYESPPADIFAGMTAGASPSGTGSGEEDVAESAPDFDPALDSPGRGFDAPAAVAPEDELSELDRKLAELDLGNIAFNAPETIPYGEAATIELLASLKEAADALREAVRGDGPVESAQVQLGDRMEARLTGTGFRIEAITPEVQALSRQQRTQWRWEIEPTRPADLELHLTLSAIFRIDGESVTRTIQTFERTIDVDVPFTRRVSNFVAGNYQFIGSAVVIPIVGGLYHRHRKKRRAAAATAPQADRKAA
jgi:hypothetical protein